MADPGTGEKTEAPTDQKLKQLRKKNTVRKSQDLPAAMSIAALVLAMPMLASGLWDGCMEMMTTLFRVAGSTDTGEALGVIGFGVVTAFKPTLIPLAIVAAATVLTMWGYTRSKPNPHAIKPMFSKLNPVSGVKNLLSVNSLVELIKGVSKMTAVGFVAFLCWKGALEDLLSGFSSVEGAAGIIGDAVQKMLLWVACVAIVIGVLDAIWQNKRYGKQAKMSKYDVQREFKQSEGDPMLKAQIRQRGQALSRNAMVAAAADADVVVVNPTHIAVALKYEAGMAAPKVVAKGQGEIALKIREVATEAGVPIKKDVPLARALHKSTKVEQFIPAELWEAAAALLSQVYREKRTRGRGAR